jgi:hypothetical protein
MVMGQSRNYKDQGLQNLDSRKVQRDRLKAMNVTVMGKI